LVEHQTGGLLFELRGKRTSLLAHQTPLHGDHSRLNQCPDSLDHYNPILRGWQQYYGRFHGSAMSVIWKHMNDYLVRWMMRKYKTLARHKTRARHALGRLARRFPTAFVHWGMGCLPAVG
ncbi:group II intron maturase-specific domain-containing protein, partial [Burkholderia cenocepacia]